MQAGDVGAVIGQGVFDQFFGLRPGDVAQQANFFHHLVAVCREGQPPGNAVQEVGVVEQVGHSSTTSLPASLSEMICVTFSSDLGLWT